jgi:hypothetical protein
MLNKPSLFVVCVLFMIFVLPRMPTHVTAASSERLRARVIYLPLHRTPAASINSWIPHKQTYFADLFKNIRYDFRQMIHVASIYCELFA